MARSAHGTARPGVGRGFPVTFPTGGGCRSPRVSARACWLAHAALSLAAGAAFGAQLPTPAAAEASCGDAGTVPLTRALYRKGWDAYENVTCIPDLEFCQSTERRHGCTYRGGDVILFDLVHLVDIGARAFMCFKGVVVLAGLLPALRTIRPQAFQGANARTSSIVFPAAGLPSLSFVGWSSFEGFRGRITIQGRFPRLTTVGPKAFFYAGDAGSTVAFTEGLPVLQAINEVGAPPWRLPHL